METPCERPKTVETCRSDSMERGEDASNNVASYLFSFSLPFKSGVVGHIMVTLASNLLMHINLTRMHQ